MLVVIRAALCLLSLAIALPIASFGQQKGLAPTPTGRITGRVTLDGQPVKGALVLLSPSSRESGRNTITKSKTDEEGRYELTPIPVGQYVVSPFALGFIPTGLGSFGQRGEPVAIGESDSSKEVNLSLTKGGVITGRIADGQGQPVAGERVTVWKLDEQNRDYVFATQQLLETDDRGVYRAYGLPPGRFRVSVGERTNEVVQIGWAASPYVTTFYPDTTDRSKAGIVEVAAGRESSDVDIKVKSSAKTYSASGRVIDAETGKPVANVPCAYSPITESGIAYKRQVFVRSPPLSNARGEFRLEDILPGRYKAFAATDKTRDSNSDMVGFVIEDGDVVGLEIKIRRAATITGVVVFEAAGGIDALEKVEKGGGIGFSSDPVELAQDLPGSGGSKIESDGTFRIEGLRAGRGRFYFRGMPGSRISRVERNGIEHPNGLVLASGEHVTGVRVFVSFGSGALNGQVKIEGGSLAEGSEVVVLIRPADTPVPLEVLILERRGAQADGQGRFTIGGVVPGDYELILLVVPGTGPGGPVGHLTPRLRQRVTVTGEDTIITLVLNLGEK